MIDTPQPFLGAIVLKAPTAGEVELLAHQMERFAAFGNAFYNRYEGGYAMKGQLYAEPLPDMSDIEDLQLEQRTLMAQLVEVQAQLEKMTLDRKNWQRVAEQRQEVLDLLTPDEHLWVMNRRSGLPSPIGDSFGGVLPGKDVPPVPEPWELIYRYKDHGRHGQGWVCRRMLFGAEVITDLHRQPADAIDDARRLALLLPLIDTAQEDEPL